jgi:all-trans-retinol dehydrogenase (NAD+)
MDLQSKTALITGAASGIGRLMAIRMAQQGSRIIVWDIDESGMQAVAREIQSTGGECLTFQCDLANKKAIQELAQVVLKQHGSVDILINNAGIVSGHLFLDCSDEMIERTIAVNTMAPIWTTRAFLPKMIEADSGHVVTIASAAGLVGTSGLADYSASKFAMVGFDEALRMELKNRKSKVKTTVVCPFFIDTGMFEGVKTRFPLLLPILKPDYVVKKIIKCIRKKKKRIYFPRLVYTVAALRMLPVSWFDAIVRTLGVNRSMDEFKGRS